MQNIRKIRKETIETKQIIFCYTWIHESLSTFSKTLCFLQIQCYGCQTGNEWNKTFLVTHQMTSAWVNYTTVGPIRQEQRSYWLILCLGKYISAKPSPSNPSLPCNLLQLNTSFNVVLFFYWIIQWGLFCFFPDFFFLVLSPLPRLNTARISILHPVTLKNRLSRQRNEDSSKSI